MSNITGLVVGITVIVLVTFVVIIFQRMRRKWDKEDAEKNKMWNIAGQECRKSLLGKKICVVIRTKSGKTGVESALIDHLAEFEVFVKNPSEANALRAWKGESDIGLNTDYLLVGTVWIDNHSITKFYNLAFRLLNSDGSKVIGCKNCCGRFEPDVATEALILLSEILTRQKA